MRELLKVGISVVSLNISGVDVNGVRVCCALPETGPDDTSTPQQKLDLLERRLTYFAEHRH